MNIQPRQIFLHAQLPHRIIKYYFTSIGIKTLVIPKILHKRIQILSQKLSKDCHILPVPHMHRHSVVPHLSSIINMPDSVEPCEVRGTPIQSQTNLLIPSLTRTPQLKKEITVVQRANLWPNQLTNQAIRKAKFSASINCEANKTLNNTPSRISNEFVTTRQHNSTRSHNTRRSNFKVDNLLTSAHNAMIDPKEKTEKNKTGRVSSHFLKRKHTRTDASDRVGKKYTSASLMPPKITVGAR